MGQLPEPTQDDWIMSDTAGRIRPWMRWLLVLPSAFGADLLAQWFLSPSLLVRAWEGITNHLSPLGPWVDAITWQAWAPAWFVWAGTKVAPSRRARVSVCLAGFKVVVASANILARIHYVQRGGSWWRLEDPPLDVPVWWFAGASALGILVVALVSARFVLKERLVGGRERRKGLGYDWFWYGPTWVAAVTLLVIPAALSAWENLETLFRSFRWWEMLFSPSAYIFFSATGFSIFGPMYPLALMPAFFADKESPLYPRRYLLSALCAGGSVILSYVALFICWGSFPRLVDDGGFVRLRMIPFLPLP